MKHLLDLLNPFRQIGRYIKAHHLGAAALVGGAFAAAVLFFVVGAAVRLLIGPVSLGPFAGTLTTALARALPGMTVKYDQAAIEWTRDEGRVNLVILGTRVFDADGRIIAQAPKADIDLAAKPLLHGAVVVKRIALIGVQLTLVHMPDGGLRLGVEQDKQESDILARISDALKANDGSTVSLQTFAIRSARIAFYDEPTGLFVVAPQADLRMVKSGNDLDAKIDAAVEISGRPARIVADIQIPPKHGDITGDVAVTGFDLAALADNSKTFAMLKGAALRLDLSASFTGDGTRLLTADFGVGARGAIDLPGGKNERVRIGSLRAVGRYDGRTGRLLIEDAAIASDKLKGQFAGKFEIAKNASGDLDRIRGDFRIDKLLLAFPQIFAEPVALSSIELRGGWVPASRTIAVDRLDVRGAPLTLTASGNFTLVEGRAPAVEMKGTLGPLNTRELVRYWPLIAARGARDWVEANIPAGVVSSTSLDVHLPAGALDGGPLPASALSVKFTLDKGEINYVKGLTHLTNVEGAGLVTGAVFEASVSSARIGPLQVSGGRFAIPDLNAADETGIVTAHLQGEMPDVLALVDMPPLGYSTRFGIKPGDAKGTAAVDLTFRVPMRKALGVDDVKVDVKAAIGGFSVALGPHTRLTDGTLAVAITNNALHAIGTTGLGGSASRLNVDWTEDFKTSAALTTRLAVKGSLDERARVALDMQTDGYIAGPVGVSGTMAGRRGKLKQANLTVDLTPAVVTLDEIGLNKPAGFPTTARVQAVFGNHGEVASETIHANGPGTTVAANAAFDANGRLVQLLASPVRIGPLDDFALNLTRGDSGVNIVVRGKSLDGTRLARRGTEGNKQDSSEPYHVNARLDRLVLRDGVTLSPFTLDVSGVSNQLASMTLAGSFSKTTSVTGSITPADSARKVNLTTSDVGLLTRGLFGFNSMRGGKAEVTAVLNGKPGAQKDANAPDFQGKMTFTDFRVTDQPFLARLFSAGSLGGLINLLQGQGIAVDKLEVPFASHNGVISIHDVRATGPAIGITADGYIDRPKNDIALKGSLVPLYSINSVLGNIPLLGDVLTSKQGEGIIGMSYAVTGNADEPSVSVNPLSVLAPGILRRIFEGKMPTAAQAPSNAAPVPSAPPEAAKKL